MKDLVIRLRYVTVHDRLRPEPAGAISVERTIELRLSPKGEISETYGRALGRAHAESEMVGRAGGREIVGPTWDPANGQVRWHIVDANTIVRVRGLAQSVQTITVVIHGQSCEMEFEDRLKLGFTEVKNTRLDAPGVGYFSLERVSEASCKVE